MNARWFFGLYFLMLVCVLSCHSRSKNVAILEYDGKYPDESARNIEIIMSDSGRITFSLYAPLMNSYLGDEPYTDFPEGVIASSYSNGEKHATITANYAINRENLQLIEARGNVVIVDLAKEESILTEKIIWDQRNKRVFSDVEVTQIKADGTVNKGDGFESNEKFTKYTIINSRGEFIADEL